MTMALQKNKAINVFDKYSLVIPPKLKFHEDGIPGKRVLFITDQEESFIITFEEGMKLMDMMPDDPMENPTIRFQYCKDGKYIHQRRIDTFHGNGRSYSFFHMELEDEDGHTVYLPGQMMASEAYAWSDGIEPVLMELLERIAVETKTSEKEERK